MHWLVNAAVRAGLPGAGTATIPQHTPLSAAWELRIPEASLAAGIAPTLRVGVADFERVEPKAARLVPEKVARKHGVFALRESDRELTVASSDPQDYEAERDLGFASGRRIVFELAAPSTITDQLTGTYSADRIVENLLAAADSTLADAVRVVEDMEPAVVEQGDVESAPLVKLANLILSDAVVQRASDIHIEPGGPRVASCAFASTASCARTWCSRRRPSTVSSRASRCSASSKSPIVCGRRTAARESRC